MNNTSDTSDTSDASDSQLRPQAYPQTYTQDGTRPVLVTAHPPFATVRFSGHGWDVAPSAAPPFLYGTAAPKPAEQDGVPIVGGSAQIDDLVCAALEVLGRPTNVVIHVLPPLPSDRVIVVIEEGVPQSPVLYWEPVTSPCAIQRAEHGRQLQADPILVAIHVARGAPERAASRERAVLVAACSYVLDEEILDAGEWVRTGLGSPDRFDQMTSDQFRWARMVAALDAHGVGGPFALGGDRSRTIRLSAFVGLGAGRRRAVDGESWTRAIQTAALSLPAIFMDPSAAALASSDWDTPSVLFGLVTDGVLRDADLIFGLTYALSRAYDLRHSPELSGPWVAVARAISWVARRAQLDTDLERLIVRYDVDALSPAEAQLEIDRAREPSARVTVAADRLAVLGVGNMQER